MKTIAVIPARYASTRMPGKPLADVLGKPMIWWVYKAAKACPKLDDVLIATDGGFSDTIRSDKENHSDKGIAERRGS